MKIETTLTALREYSCPIVLAAGFFDGVHVGHLKILRATMARAQELNGQSWVLTFDRHPMHVLNPEAAPLLLTANRHKEMLLNRTGVDGCLMLEFTPEFAQHSPREFVSQLEHAVPGLTELVVGRNWRFGHRGEGTPGLISRIGHSGWDARVMQPVIRHGETVSSTRIRAQILRGNLDEAAAMLGRPVSILGTVVTGRNIGARIGFPTANLDPHNEVLPPHGVYAVRAFVDPGDGHDDTHALNGVLNFGLRPTVHDGETIATLELHLFDFHGNLYERDIEVFFHSFLRREEKFPTMEIMREQIARDVALARQLLGRPLPASKLTGKPVAQ